MTKTRNGHHHWSLDLVLFRCLFLSLDFGLTMEQRTKSDGTAIKVGEAADTVSKKDDDENGNGASPQDAAERESADGEDSGNSNCNIDITPKTDSNDKGGAAVGKKGGVMRGKSEPNDVSSDKSSGEGPQWEDMFQRLLAYREKHGDCLVPNRYPEDPQLGNWVSSQRRHYKILTSKNGQSSPMTPERARRLMKVGFRWFSQDPRYVCLLPHF
jgi:hypothetical protein